jgi:hypothetical protein
MKFNGEIYPNLEKIDVRSKNFNFREDMPPKPCYPTQNFPG